MNSTFKPFILIYFIIQCIVFVNSWKCPSGMKILSLGMVTPIPDDSRHIKCQGIGLREIYDGSIDHLTSLTKVYMQNNKLHILNVIFKKTAKVEVLIFRNNSIRSIRGSWGHLLFLTRVDLSFNQLVSFDKRIFKVIISLNSNLNLKNNYFNCACKTTKWVYKLRNSRIDIEWPKYSLNLCKEINLGMISSSNEATYFKHIYDKCLANRGENKQIPSTTITTVNTLEPHTNTKEKSSKTTAVNTIEPHKNSKNAGEENEDIPNYKNSTNTMDSVNTQPYINVSELIEGNDVLPGKVVLNNIDILGFSVDPILVYAVLGVSVSMVLVACVDSVCTGASPMAKQQQYYSSTGVAVAGAVVTSAPSREDRIVHIRHPEGEYF